MSKEKEPVFVKYDEATRKWFSKRPGAQTTVMCCEKCGLWYEPMLGHACIAYSSFDSERYAEYVVDRAREKLLAKGVI